MSSKDLDVKKQSRRVIPIKPFSTEPYNLVAGVITHQGNDQSALINDFSARYYIPPRLMVALGIAESNLDEYSRRPPYDSQISEYWPDVSYGCYHQTVKYAPVGDGSASIPNCNYVRDWLWEFVNALDTAAKYISPFYLKYQDGPEAMSRYNSPGLSLAENPNQANIMRGWNESAAYETGDSMPITPPDAPIGQYSFFDVRNEFPYYPGNGEYDTRDLSAITQVVYHHGASAMPDATYDAEMEMLHRYEALHTQQNGWPAIAYHMAIGSSGNIYWMNGLDLISYHAVQANPYSIGIVYIGNFEHNQPPPNMLAASIAARLWCASQCGRDEFPYLGHRDVYATACPGDWWDEGKYLLETYPEEPPDEGEDQALIDQLTAENEALKQQNAGLINKLGYLQGDVANAIDTGAQHVLESKKLAKAKDITENEILPAVNTLKTA
jgi:hypothetical protein